MSNKIEEFFALISITFVDFCNKNDLILIKKMLKTRLSECTPPSSMSLILMIENTKVYAVF